MKRLELKWILVSIAYAFLVVAIVLVRDRSTEMATMPHAANVYLFAEPYDQLDLKNFSPEQTPKFEVYLLETHGCLMNLKEQWISCTTNGLVRLPLPTTQLGFMRSVPVTLSLDNWRTVVVLESEHDKKTGKNENIRDVVLPIEYGLREYSYRRLLPWPPRFQHDLR